MTQKKITYIGFRVKLCNLYIMNGIDYFYLLKNKIKYDIKKLSILFYTMV